MHIRKLVAQKLVPVGALLAFILPAIAQQPSAPNPPMASPPAPSTTTAPMGTSTTTTMQPRWYTTHNDEMRSSKLIGTAVRNAANESIGDINEILIDKTGKVAAVIVGVGGFLGMGEREVAVAFDSLQWHPQTTGRNYFSIDATKDTLKSAPAWTWPRS